MTGPTDPTEMLLEQSLNRHAAQAPADDLLLDHVHVRIHRRRRTVRAVGGSVLAAAAVLAVIISTSAGKELSRPDSPPEVAGPASDGWRWESYRKVELQVPATWGYGVDLSQWCVGYRREAKRLPFVGRPGVSTMAYCPEVPDLDRRVPYVSFDEDRAGLRSVDHGWVWEARSIAGTVVTVFSDDPGLRARIFASAREITGTDVNGCAPNHPAAADPTTRPRSEGGLGTVGDVKSVAVCGYELRTAGTEPLFTGRTFTGTAATGLVDAIRSAPAGSGPNNPPDTCVPEDLGERVYVVVVHGSQHDQEVIVRYAGCQHNGTDDGDTERRLTTDVLSPILTGADRIGSMSRAVGDLLGLNRPERGKTK
jgi:hypothetical protein